MAELLIKAVSATHANPAKDAAGCYKRGDVIRIEDDGYSWGRLESLPPAQGGKAVIVKITGPTAAQVRNFIRTKWNTDIAEDTDILGKPLRRRRIRIDLDDVPGAVKQQLYQTGQFTTTWAAIRQFVRNKHNNETAANSSLGG